MNNTSKILIDFLGFILNLTHSDNRLELKTNEIICSTVLLCSEKNIDFLEYLKLEECPLLLKQNFNILKQKANSETLINCLNSISKYNTITNIKETYTEAWQRCFNQFNYYQTNYDAIYDVEEDIIEQIKKIHTINGVLTLDAAYKIIKNESPKNYYSCPSYRTHNDIFFFSYKTHDGKYKSLEGKGSETKENIQYYCYKLKCLNIISSQYDTTDALYNLSIDCNGMLFIDSIEGKISIYDFIDIYKDVIKFGYFTINYNDENPVTEKGFYSILNLIINTMRDDRVTIKINNIKLPKNLSTLGVEINFTERELKSITEKYIPLDKIKLIELKEEQLQTSKDLLFFNFDDFSSHYFNRNLIITETSSILIYAHDGIFFATNSKDIVIFILGCKERQTKTMNAINKLYN